MNAGLFSMARKPLNILRGGIGGTGDRKGAGTGLIQSACLPDHWQLFHQGFNGLIQRTHAKLNGGYNNV